MLLAGFMWLGHCSFGGIVDPHSKVFSPEFSAVVAFAEGMATSRQSAHD